MKKIRNKTNNLKNIKVYLAVFLWAVAFVLINIFANINFVIFTLISVSAIYLLCFHYDSIRNVGKELPLILLVLLGYLIGFAVLHYFKLSAYYIPAASIPMLAILLFPFPEIALFIAIITAVIVGVISSGDFTLTVVFLIGGIIGVCASWQARRRWQLVRAGLLVGLGQFFAFAFFNNFRFVERLVLNTGFILFANGLISCALVMILLPALEYLFRVVTDISLLELSDMNNPLIKRMIIEAPGTYHHSLIVGNLSEAAAQAIGANAMLARVGSYFHDIGKIEKANYFSENQKDEQSAHENLNPSMSKLVIMNHVKDGIELANKYHLKPAIIDFISQHHGKSLVYYFYHRALTEEQGDQEIKEEPFRYPGPKPQTKETAIVLLADSVEAATRSVEDPTPSRIEEVVRRIINNKFIDGQLDECDLTLRDLERIADVFSRILSGFYHVRIDYPEQNGDKNKKSAKQNSHKPAGNGKDSKAGFVKREGEAKL